jgi:hypothetical protein
MDGLDIIAVLDSGEMRVQRALLCLCSGRAHRQKAEGTEN